MKNNNNPTGINQYSRSGAGALRLKTGKFYHGTPKVFRGPVMPLTTNAGAIAGFTAASGKAYASGSLRTAKVFANGANGANRLLQVRLGEGARIIMGGLVAISTKPMRVVRTLPTLRKPSRRAV